MTSSTTSSTDINLQTSFEFAFARPEDHAAGAAVGARARPGDPDYPSAALIRLLARQVIAAMISKDRRLDGRVL